MSLTDHDILWHSKVERCRITVTFDGGEPPTYEEAAKAAYNLAEDEYHIEMTENTRIKDAVCIESEKGKYVFNFTFETLL